jgi:hypothetical protein
MKTLLAFSIVALIYLAIMAYEKNRTERKFKR